MSLKVVARSADPWTEDKLQTPEQIRRENKQAEHMFKLIGCLYRWRNDRKASGYGRWEYAGPGMMTAQEARDMIDDILAGNPPYILD